MSKPYRPLGLDVELRVMINGVVAIGPIQATLLGEIHNMGSIAAAQRRLGSPYAYIWKLVAAMNDKFSPPLVVVSRGSAEGGGARLTPLGHQVLDAFRKLEHLVRVEGRSELKVIGRSARKQRATEVVACR